MDSAVTYDLIKAGTMLPKCRLSVCLPQDMYKFSAADNVSVSNVKDDNKTITGTKCLAKNDDFEEPSPLYTPEKIILAGECSPINCKQMLIPQFDNSLQEERSLMEIDEIEEFYIEASTPKSRNNNTKTSFNEKNKSFDSLPPIKETSPMDTVDANMKMLNDKINCDHFCAKRELSFSDKDSTLSPAAPTAKRRKTMSPNEAFSRKYKKSPKESFKTLSSIRRSLRLKTMNSLTKWISSNDVSGKVSSPVPRTFKRVSKPFNISSGNLLPAQADVSPQKSLNIDVHKESSRHWSSGAVEEDNSHRMPVVLNFIQLSNNFHCDRMVFLLKNLFFC